MHQQREGILTTLIKWLAMQSDINALSCNEDLHMLVSALFAKNGVLRQALRDHKERLDVCVEGLSQQVKSDKTKQN